MKVLIIGAEGQLGVELCQAFSDTDLARADLDGPGIHLDLCDPAAVRRCVAQELRPALVVNAAAAHNVPFCEEHPEVAFAVNAAGARHLALACREAHARLIHVSTDYVFGNAQHRPYVETDLPAPLSVYGASKVAGEYLIAAECPEHVIVRTAALYGAAPCRAKGGRNFVQTMLHLASMDQEVRVVTDEITTPTPAAALARQIRRLAEEAEPGAYHATCQGACSWFDFARAIFDETNTAVRLSPALSADFPSPVKRPRYSVLDNKHARDQGLDIMPEWRDALREYLTIVPQRA